MAGYWKYLHFSSEPATRLGWRVVLLASFMIAEGLV